MVRKQALTAGGAFKLLLIASALSALAAPRGFDMPRRLLGPVLAPLSASGIYVCDTVRVNMIDLASGNADSQTLSEILQANPELKSMLTAELDGQLNSRLAAYEMWLGDYKQLVDELTQARQSLGSDFACMLIPSRVVGSSASYYSGSDRLLKTDEKTQPGSMVTTRELLTGRPTALPEKLAALVGSQLVGRIESSSGWTAKLQLLTDPDFRIQGAVLRMVDPENPRMITTNQTDEMTGKVVPTRRELKIGDPVIYVNLSGCGDGLVSAELPALHAIAPGDRVFTLGDDPLLPMGVEIGTVTESKPSAQNPRHVRLKIKPSVELNRIRNVLVVAPLASGVQNR